MEANPRHAPEMVMAQPGAPHVDRPGAGRHVGDDWRRRDQGPGSAQRSLLGTIARRCRPGLAAQPRIRDHGRRDHDRRERGLRAVPGKRAGRRWRQRWSGAWRDGSQGDPGRGECPRRCDRRWWRPDERRRWRGTCYRYRWRAVGRRCVRRGGTAARPRTPVRLLGLGVRGEGGSGQPQCGYRCGHAQAISACGHDPCLLRRGDIVVPSIWGHRAANCQSNAISGQAFPIASLPAAAAVLISLHVML